MHPWQIQPERRSRFCIASCRSTPAQITASPTVLAISTRSRTTAAASPSATYDDYKPLIDRLMAGDIQTLLWEEPVGWAITRGTTRGESKFIPMTPTDLQMRISAGRAMMNYVLSTRRFDLFSGVNLNLNFPSVVGTVKVGERDLEYGYSSGIYTKYVSAFTPIRSVPSQDEIDALGGGKSIQDWDRRFELAYEKCKNENVTLVGGVCPTALRFARYLKRVHKAYPKDLWKTQVMTLGKCARHQYPLQPIAESAVRSRCHPRDLRRHRRHVRSAVR